MGPAVPCCFHQMRGIRYLKNWSLLLSERVFSLICGCTSCISRTPMHSEEFPVWACTISSDEKHLETNTFHLTHTLPYNGVKLICSYTCSSKMGKGELQFEKDASNHQNKEMCGNWSMLLITPTFSLKGQQVIVYVSKVILINPTTLPVHLSYTRFSFTFISSNMNPQYFWHSGRLLTFDSFCSCRLSSGWNPAWCLK